MSSLEERVAYLEGRLEDHGGAVTDLRGAASQVNNKIDSLTTRMDEMGVRLTTRMDAMGAALTTRIDALSTRMDALDQRLNAKMDRHFMWLVGIQIATLVAIIGALLRRS